jgi:hypothetical protein
MVKKLLHDPIVFLKRVSKRTRKDFYLDVARKLFHLDEDRTETGEEDEDLSLDSDTVS